MVLQQTKTASCHYEWRRAGEFSGEEKRRNKGSRDNVKMNCAGDKRKDETESI